MGDVREELNRLAERVMDLTTTPASMPEQDRISASLRSLAARGAVPEGWRDVLKRAREGLGAGGALGVPGSRQRELEIEIGGAMIDHIEDALAELAAAPQPEGEAVHKPLSETMYRGPAHPDNTERLKDRRFIAEPAPSAPAGVEALAREVSDFKPEDGWTRDDLVVMSPENLREFARRLSATAVVKDCLTTADVGALAKAIFEAHREQYVGTSLWPMRGWDEIEQSTRDHWTKVARRLYGAQQARALEALDETDKDIAVAQAVEFAQYVVDHAKGRMVEAAERFLSLPYSQEVAGRLVQAQQAAKGGAE